MAAPTAADVAAFLGKAGDAATEAIAAEALPVITAMVRSYCRDAGFTVDGPAADIAAAIVTATARLITNPGQLSRSDAMGPFSTDVRGGFTGFTLPELFVLDRYRQAAI